MRWGGTPLDKFANISEEQKIFFANCLWIETVEEMCGYISSLEELKLLNRWLNFQNDLFYMLQKYTYTFKISKEKPLTGYIIEKHRIDEAIKRIECINSNII